MKKIIFFICVLTVVSAYSQMSNMSLMTYNIRLDVASDKENAWINRKEDLIKQLEFHKPSIFGIQEGLPHQVAFLQEALHNYALIGIGRDGGDNGEYAALFYNKERYEVLRSKTFWLSLTPEVPSKNWDAALPRICTYGLFKEKNTGLKFWVFNTHFDHIGETARLHSVSLILSKIEAENKEDLPVIFMGDLNVTPQSEVIKRLGESMTDSKDASLKKPLGPSGTFNGFRFDIPVTKRIDYIFVSQGKQIEVLKYAVWSDSNNLRYPSDHLPVYIEINLYSR